MTRHFQYIIIVTLLFIVSCSSVRPETDTGPVIDSSRNVAAGIFVPGGSAPAIPIFIRHFHYYSQPATWSVFSSGDSSPQTRFEEAGVYALTFRGINAEPFITRLARIPGISMDGVTPPRIHLAISAPGPLGTGNSNAIVYVEDGPIYSGLDVGIDLSGGAPAIDMPLRMLVNTRVRAAALSGDGETIAYVDDQGRLFFKVGDREPEQMIDIRATLGSADVHRIQWTSFGGGPLLVLNRGFGVEVRRLERQFETRLVRTFQDPDTIQEPGSGQLPFIDQITNDMTPEAWSVPEPARFSG